MSNTLSKVDLKIAVCD